MDDFIVKLGDIFAEWYREDQQKTNEKELLILDYHPLIGSISLQHDRYTAYYYFKNDLKNLAKIKHVSVRIICFNDSDNSEMFQVLKSLKTTIPYHCNRFSDIPDDIDYDHELKDFASKFEKDTTNIAIWFTSKINPLHFVITDNKAFQYSVIPSGSLGSNQKRNVLMGFESEDLFQIEFLRSTFKSIETLAITPKINKKDKDNDHFVLEFEKQINIAKIILLRKDKTPLITIDNKNDGILERLEIKKSSLVDAQENCSEFFIKLQKVNGIGSTESELINISEN